MWKGEGKWLPLKLGKLIRLGISLRSADSPILETECNSLHGFCQEAQQDSPGKSGRYNRLFHKLVHYHVTTLRDRQNWISIVAPQFISCVAVDKLSDFFLSLRKAKASCDTWGPTCNPQPCLCVSEIWFEPSAFRETVSQNIITDRATLWAFMMN